MAYRLFLQRLLIVGLVLGFLSPTLSNESAAETLLERMKREQGQAAPPQNSAKPIAVPPPSATPDEPAFEEAFPVESNDSSTRPARPLDWPPERYMKELPTGDEGENGDQNLKNFKTLRVPLAEGKTERQPGQKRSVTFTAPRAHKPAPAGQDGRDTVLNQEAYTGYVLGHGDKLKITVFGEEELSGVYTVNDAGQISYPLLGEVEVKNLNVLQVKDRLNGLLKQGYLHDPNIAIEVMDFRPFYITGEVRSPGSFPYVADMRVMNAIVLAGGFTFRADQDEVKIQRNTASGTIKLKDVGTGEKVFPGDIIVVEERFF